MVACSDSYMVSYARIHALARVCYLFGLCSLSQKSPEKHCLPSFVEIVT